MLEDGLINGWMFSLHWSLAGLPSPPPPGCMTGWTTPSIASSRCPTDGVATWRLWGAWPDWWTSWRRCVRHFRDVNVDINPLLDLYFASRCFESLFPNTCYVFPTAALGRSSVTRRSSRSSRSWRTTRSLLCPSAGFHSSSRSSRRSESEPT